MSAPKKQTPGWNPANQKPKVKHIRIISEFNYDLNTNLTGCDLTKKRSPIKRFSHAVWNWRYSFEELRRFHFNTSQVWQEAICCTALGTLRVVDCLLRKTGG